MSDPHAHAGEPVEEPASDVEDVVGSAQAGLAAAAAAGADAAGARADDADAAGGRVDAGAAGGAEPRLPDITVDEPIAPAADSSRAFADAPAEADAPAADDDADGDDVFATPALNDAYRAGSGAAEAVPVATGPDSTRAEGAPSPDEPAAPTEPAVTPVDEAAAAPTTVLDAAAATAGDSSTTQPTTPMGATADVAAAAGAPAAASSFDLQMQPAEQPRPQPIFVQAPEEPRPRGNRGAAGAIGLVAAVAFAALYLGAALAVALVAGTVTVDGAGPWLVKQLTTWDLWVPTVVFFIAFWLLGSIVNRGRWGVWVTIGLLVGVAAWGGHLLGQLFAAPFWMVSAADSARIVRDQLFAPLAVAAFVVGRELTVWFGAWAAARGRRMTELNIEARREYERTLEAGPQAGR